MAQQVRRNDGLGCQAAQVAGNREWSPQAPAGRSHAGERGHERGSAKKVVSASARRELVRHMNGQGLIPLSAGDGSQLRPQGKDHRLGATSSTLRCRHDLFEAAPGRRAGEPQAGRSPVCPGRPASVEAQAQKDSARRATSFGAPDVGQPSVVHGLRV